MRLGILVGTHVMARSLGEVFNSDTGFVLARDPDTVRAPDVSFLRVERIPPTGIPDGYIDGPPDLAIEVVSPSDTLYEVEETVAEYLAAGTRLVWVVNPKRRTVTVHAPDADPRVLDESAEIDGGEVVPGFRCAMRDVMG